MNGGRFDFDDGGTFCGGWEEGKAHGHGVCTGPDAQGEYAGAWHYGFEVSGIYTWPSGSTYAGQWQNGKRHGLGVEQRGRWVYKGEWAQGFKGRYGRREATNSGAHYLGTWSSGLHDGYGTEIYADGGSYKGQWLRGMRHGYGIRTSAAYGIASKHRSRSNRHGSLTSLRSNNYDEYEESNMLMMDTSRSKDKSLTAEEKGHTEMRGGFVIKARSSAPSKRRRSLSERSLAVKRSILSNLRIKKQHSTGDIHQRVTSGAGSLRSSGSTISCNSDESDHHRHVNEYEMTPEDKIDAATTETYKGEWKNDARSGYGVCERSDGLRYAGEWQDNKKHGYGVTFFKDGTTSKLRERVESNLDHAKRAAEIAIQRVDIALSRTMTAQERADASVEAAERARDDADTARIYAAQFDPNFRQPGIEHMRQSRVGARHALTNHIHTNHVSFESTTSAIQHPSSSSTAAYNKHSQPISYHQFNHKQQQNNQHQAIPEFYIHHQQQQSNLAMQHRAGESQIQLDLPGGTPINPFPPQIGNQLQLKQQPDAETSSVMGADNSQSNSTKGVGDSSDRTQYPRESSTQYFDGGDEASSSSAVHPSTIQQHSKSNSNPYDYQTATGENSTASTSKLTGNSVGHNRQSTPLKAGDQSPGEVNLAPHSRAVNRKGRHREAGSTMSLSDDHFDQYTIRAAGLGAADSGLEGSYEARLRRNRPSLIRQPEVNDGVNLNRRSTLATSRNRTAECHAATGMLPNEWNYKAQRIAGDNVDGGDRGSLPNLDDLATQSIYLKREEASRLASQRRQEAQRLLEEEQLLKANPLRYLYHPLFRSWLARWKVPLLLALGNILLLYYLVQLLTDQRESGKTDSTL